MVDKKEEKKNLGRGFGVVGFVLGIESIIFAILIPALGIFLSIHGIIFSSIQQKKQPIKKGKLGIILNIIGFVLSISVWIASIVIFLKLQNQNFPA